MLVPAECLYSLLRRVEIVESRTGEHHALAFEGNTVAFEQAPLARSPGKRPIRPDDPVPWHIVSVGAVEHVTCQTRCTRRHVAVGSDVARGNRAHPLEDREPNITAALPCHARSVPHFAHVCLTPPMDRELPLGEELDWRDAQAPQRAPMRGAHVLLRPVEPAVDAAPLFAASHPPHGDLATWTYLPDGPYRSPEHMRAMLEWAATSDDPVYFTIAGLPDELPLGVAAYLRITPAFGTIEIGHIWFGARLRRSTAATEAIYLLASHAFDQLGYRRLEWKCNALNAASRRAAERFGFTFEGVFRKHQVVKGRNRDTAWYAITDQDWPAIGSGFRAWLEPENFDDDARQLRSLQELIRAAQDSHLRTSAFARVMPQDSLQPIDPPDPGLPAGARPPGSTPPRG